MRTVALLASLALTVGCTTAPAEPRADEIVLSQALGVTAPEVIGVTVAPDTGAIYLLDRVHGLYELGDDGSAVQVRSLDALPVPDVPARSLYTDFVALGDDIFALVARSDGYRLDLGADSLTRYFCYEPGWEEPVVEQLTESVAFDADRGVLYAQPQSFNMDQDPETPFAAGVGAYSLEGGQPTSWLALDDVDLLAGGMTVAGTDLLLVQGSELLRVRPDEDGAVTTSQLESLGHIAGLSQADGIAWDSDAGELLVVDSGADRLVRYALEL